MLTPWLALALATPAPTAGLELAGHRHQVDQYGQVDSVYTPPARGALPPPTSGPNMTVYGYLAYWDDDLASVPWDEITHLAIFNAAANTDGSLSDTSRWDIAEDAVAMAAPYGVKVHLAVTNFNTTELETLLSSSTARNALIDELADWESTTGVDGINIDFEGLPVSVKDEMVQFTADLDAAVGDVVLATPAVDWGGAWNYSDLTLYADLFIMGYGYHWSGSSYAGPTDPLYAGTGTLWDGINSRSLSWSLDDYLFYGADPDRVILGLPLYGNKWDTASNAVPSATQSTGSAIFFAEAWDAGAVHGTSYEPDCEANYTHDGTQQIWFGDVETVRSRIIYARDVAGVGGIGFWALHYDDDDPDMWQMVRDETQFASGTTTTPTGGGPTDTGTSDTSGTTNTDPSTNPGTSTEGTEPTEPSTEFQARVGRPFLVYVGDKVQLDGSASVGPGELEYSWLQVQGPGVVLEDESTPKPTFVVEEAVNLVFELRVGNGGEWSAPARSTVVVIDPERGKQLGLEGGCGCTGGPATTPWLGLVLGLFARSRRRPAR